MRVNRGEKSYDHEFWRHARRLVRKQQQYWKDEWWPIGRVAKYHGVDDHLVRLAIYQGKLPAVDWGNYFILKSHATDPELSFRRYIGRGGKGQDHLSISPEARAFMVLANAVGLMDIEIGPMMGWPVCRVNYLLSRMRKEGRMPGIIREHKLRVVYDSKTSKTFASWRVYRDRFPRLARFMESLDGRRLSIVEIKQANNVTRRSERWREHIRNKFGVPA